MKILLLLILFAAVFCIPAQTADIMPGAGYKISALQVEQQSGNIAQSGQMFQVSVPAGVLPGVEASPPRLRVDAGAPSGTMAVMEGATQLIPRWRRPLRQPQ